MGFAARRSAEEFEALVSDPARGAGSEATAPASRAREDELLALVTALRAVPAAEPRPEFVADLRARLMAEADTVLVPDVLSRLRLPARQTGRERRLAALVGGIAVVGATASVAVAAQSALPGESLYPIKRVLESARGGLSVGEADKGRQELANAGRRLDEVDALAQDADAVDAARIESTLDAFSSQATDGADLLLADFAHSGRESSVSELRDFAASSLEELRALEPRVPAEARDELVDAAGTLAEIDAEAGQQCPTCGGAPLGQIPAALTVARIELPSAAEVLRQTSTGAGSEQQSGEESSTDSSGSGDGAQSDPGSEVDLPEIGDAVPPGSVLTPPDATPTTGASATANPLQQLTQGLTEALTGTGGKQTRGGSASPTAAASPVREVVEGVGEILEGVLDPITGTLLEGGTPQLP